MADAATLEVTPDPVFGDDRARHEVVVQAASMNKDAIKAAVLRAVRELRQPSLPRRDTIVKFYGDVDWPDYPGLYKLLQEVYVELDLLTEVGESFLVLVVDPLQACRKNEQIYLRVTRHLEGRCKGLDCPEGAMWAHFIEKWAERITEPLDNFADQDVTNCPPDAVESI